MPVNMAPSRAPPRSAIYIVIAILIPFAVGALQWQLWDYLAPSVWVFLYPALFFAAMIGGLWGGIGATVVATLIGWFAFIPTQFPITHLTPGIVLGTLTFFSMGVVFSILQWRHNNLLWRDIENIFIQKSEKFMRLIADNVPAKISYFDNNLKCYFFNKNHVEWYGRSDEQIIGMKLPELLGVKTFEESKCQAASNIRPPSASKSRPLASYQQLQR